MSHEMRCSQHLQCERAERPLVEDDVEPRGHGRVEEGDPPGAVAPNGRRADHVSVARTSLQNGTGCRNAGNCRETPQEPCARGPGPSGACQSPPPWHPQRSDSRTGSGRLPGTSVSRWLRPDPSLSRQTSVAQLLPDMTGATHDLRRVRLRPGPREGEVKASSANGDRHAPRRPGFSRCGVAADAARNSALAK